MRADGSQVIQLTDDAAFDTFPVWSPDGQTILFATAPAE
jgi:Tol biopolymer transport system component